jgi:uncharacterized membrane protein YozB (DUF420 family)
MRERAVLPAIGVVSVLVVGLVGLLMVRSPAPGEAGLGVASLPSLNAALNAASALLLVTGFALVRARRLAAHRACMLGAFALSTLFLVSYVVYHYHAGSRPFTGQGWVRPVYFALLLSHIVLAAGIVPLALTTLYRGLRDDRARHVRLARWTLPLWLYVSVTGVVVYWMLHHLGSAS